MRSFTLKENHIGLAVTEILQYTQINTCSATFIKWEKYLKILNGSPGSLTLMLDAEIQN